MTYYYSNTKKGFYHDSVHSKMPDDAFAITDEHHANLINGQANGNEIVFLNGFVTLQPAMIPVSMDDIRSQRNALLTQSDWTQFSDIPHTDEQKAAWKQYRQDLRNIPQTFNDPKQVIWPIAPNKGN